MVNKKNIFELTNTVKESLISETENYQINNSTYINIAWKITKHLNEDRIEKTCKIKRNKRKISIRINKNDFELEDIIEKCPTNVNCSEYLCNIIYSYLKEPQCERERYLHKDIIDVINKAITNKENIKVYTKSGKIHCVDPKEICTSQEGLYNYLICQGYSEKTQDYYANTIHIYNILNVRLRHAPSIFQPKIEMRLERMKKNGVQFSINDDTIYKIKLTDVGITIFNSRYLERPTPLSKSDKNLGIYYFDCSKMQFKSYFAPFQNNVIILEPQEMINDIVNEYEKVLNNYK